MQACQMMIGFCERIDGEPPNVSTQRCRVVLQMHQSGRNRFGDSCLFTQGRVATPFL